MSKDSEAQEDPLPHDTERGDPDFAFAYDGIRRVPYFLWMLLALALFGAACVFMWGSSLVSGAAMVSSFAIYFLFTVRRLQNIGANGYLVLLSFVPVANLILATACLALPQGYWDHRNLDTAGKAVFFVCSSVIVVSLMRVALVSMR